MDLRIFNSPQDVAREFSAYFAQLANSLDSFQVALSGGSTPKIVFGELADRYKTSIPWDRVHFYWGDERCVPPEDDQSNYKMTREFLLSKIDIPEANIHRILGEDDPPAEAIRYGELIEKNLPLSNGIPQFDMVILGMGDDGHTASIFPHEIELWHSANNCEVAIHPDSGQKRVSLTGKIINNAQQVAFLVTGANKAEKVYEIMNQQGDYLNYPASLVKPKSGQLIWFMDKNAAAGCS